MIRHTPITTHLAFSVKLSFFFERTADFLRLPINVTLDKKKPIFGVTLINVTSKIR